ncbi:MAG: hypothetical protein J7463_07175 [Roseiflexus sp.]|jgi:putative transposase|nr:hypothetical protein [Roseiflexus sp.]MBO9333418.1 hypothetical protein [Roseiflexus sp.]MBO9342462.1 hypothetical protein [Roseiflexus sp.]MBO9365603.1 hypothetical protein [Roseiflexus sp.]MBO9382939.1 hypothetical protein [Roseiflexus sp.]
MFLNPGHVDVAQFDELKGIDWDWLRMSGAVTKAPLEGENNRSQSDRGKVGVKWSLLTRVHSVPIDVAIDSANRHDIKLVCAMGIVVERPAPTEEQPQGV